ISLPSNLKTVHNLALQRRSAVAAIVSNTGWVSVGELEITRRISEVAVCCSRASASRFSRSRVVASSLIGDFGAAGRLDSTLASRASCLDASALPTSQTCDIVRGG